MVVRMEPADAVKSTLPADRKLSGTQRLHEVRTQQQTANEAGKEYPFSGQGVADRESVHFVSNRAGYYERPRGIPQARGIGVSPPRGSVRD